MGIDLPSQGPSGEKRKTLDDLDNQHEGESPRKKLNISENDGMMSDVDPENKQDLTDSSDDGQITPPPSLQKDIGEDGSDPGVAPADLKTVTASESSSSQVIYKVSLCEKLIRLGWVISPTFFYTPKIRVL